MPLNVVRAAGTHAAMGLILSLALDESRPHSGNLQIRF
jgi:hypothetical protein